MNQGIPNATAITGGANGLLDTETLNTGTGTADDVREGGRVTVSLCDTSGVADVNGNPIRCDADEFFSDGSVR